MIDTDKKTMEIRGTISAKNAMNIWSLRCEIREQLIKYRRDNYPESMPKLRQMQMQN